MRSMAWSLSSAAILLQWTAARTTEFARVTCPYCGEDFETSVDASAGLCSYVEDCQVCCQPIEMELRVDENGKFSELVLRRGDS